MSSELVRDRAAILTDLAPTSTVPERIEALKDAGFSSQALAYAVGATTSTLCNWRNGKAEPRVKYVERLNIVRQAAHILIADVGLEPSTAASFLTRRKETNGFSEYPILDILCEDPERVFEKLDVFAQSHS